MTPRSPVLHGMLGGMLGGMLWRLRRDRRGVSALEFALVAPMMILVYLGVGELCEAMMTERRCAHATSAVGDLATQSTTLAASDVSDIFAAANTIMAPFSTTPLQLRLTSVTVNAQSVAKVDWSCVTGGMTALTVGSTYTGAPTGLLVNSGDSVIVAEGRYAWTSPARYVLPNGLNFDELYYLKPRKSAQVAGPSTC